MPTRLSPNREGLDVNSLGRVVLAELSQSEADGLLAMEKTRVNEDTYDFSPAIQKLEIVLRSLDSREEFFLDISRGRINLSKGTYQNRARQTVVLARVDYGGAPHRNPDGEEIESPHLHVFKEGFADKWAQPLPADLFSDSSDERTIYSDFLRFCNITRPPYVQWGLFV
jgi:hypothetical protein